MRRTVAAISLSLVLAGCGGGDSSDSGGDENITVTGSVITATFGKDCTPNDPDGNDVAFQQVTVSDGEGTVIGTTETGEGSIGETKYEDVCEIEADYEVELPKADFYQFELASVSLQPEPVSFADLEKADFTYDLRVDSDN